MFLFGFCLANDLIICLVGNEIRRFNPIVNIAKTF